MDGSCIALEVEYPMAMFPFWSTAMLGIQRHRHSLQLFQLCTWVRVIPPVAGLSTDNKNSSLPAGGELPVRKPAGTRLYESPKPAGVMLKAIVLAGPPASIEARSSANARTPWKPRVTPSNKLTVR